MGKHHDGSSGAKGALRHQEGRDPRLTDWQLMVLMRLTVVGTAVLTGVGLVGDLMSTPLRLIVIGVAVVCVIVGLMAARERSQRRSEGKTAVENIRPSLNKTIETLATMDAGRDLEQLALHVFRGSVEGSSDAWRLSIYEIFSEEGEEAVVRLRLRRSGNQEYETGGRGSFPIDRSLFRYLRTANVSDPLIPYCPEFGGLPDRDEDPNAWCLWHKSMLLSDDVKKLRMPTRKYAFHAVRDPVSRRTIALMAESTNPEGVLKDNLAQPVVGMYVLAMLRAMELHDSGRMSIGEALRLLKFAEP